jgi:arylsulfatase A-like enzyme
MMRQVIVPVVALFGLLGAAGLAPAAEEQGREVEAPRPAPRRPNILFVVTDDQRPDTIGALGNTQIRTPTLDRLVREGTVFTRAVCAYPICHVSRAEMLTGCTAFRAQRPYATGKLNEELPTLPAVLQAAGYRTWHVGKWHINGKPTDRGFDGTRGWYTSGGAANPLTHPLDRLGQPVTGYRGWVFRDDDGKTHPERGVGLTPNISRQFADAAIELLDGKFPGAEQAGESDRPFFLHLNFTAPHDPRFRPTSRAPKPVSSTLNPEPRTLNLPKNFAPDHPFDHGNQGGRDEVLFPRPLDPAVMREEWSVYQALVEDLDEQLGRVLSKLESTNRLRDTIVIFTSDHGLAVGSHGLTGKQNMYEHSIGVPLVISGPGIPAGGRVAAQCYLRDLYPTLCDLAKTPTPPNLDGRSLLPALNGKPGPHPFVVGYFTDTQRMIRTEEWKLVRYPKIGREQLFHLKNDPEELHDLIAIPEHAATAAKLRKDLNDWLRKHNDPLSRTP